MWTWPSAPPDLLTSHCADAVLSNADRVTQPLSFLHPTLDGLVTDFFEWRGAGRIDPNPPLGAKRKAEGLFTAIYYGWDLEHLFLRIDPDEQSKARQPTLRIDVQIQTSTTQFRLSWPLGEAGRQQYVPAQRASDGSWQDLAPSRLLARHTIVEMAVPFKDLSVEPTDDRAECIVLEHGLEVARYPPQRPAT